MDAELRQQPAADEGTHNADDEVADDPRSGTLHDLTRQPSSNEANRKYDHQAFARNVHLRVLWFRSPILPQPDVLDVRPSIKADGNSMPERYAYAEAKTVLNCSRRQRSPILWTGSPIGKK